MIRSLSIAFFFFVVLIGAGVALWGWQGLQSLEQPAGPEQPVLFNVEPGRAFIQVARQLEREGLIANANWLRLHGRLFPEDTRIRAGEYEFTPGMSAREMLDVMLAGRTKLWSIQFIEGRRFVDMREALRAHERIRQVTTEMTDAEIMAALGVPDQHPEGWFFPDTYLFSSQETDLDILRRALQRMQLVLAEEWENRAEGLPYESPYEALIMASIVERETGAPHERADVAGVFVRRLQIGMRLQTDPTVIYGMGDAYQGRITRRDLQTHTPYNTYRIHGLTPTPIAMPGREAIHAALNPAEGDTLYFVARGDGTHQFSRTLAEHNAAVRRYQLNRRSDYRSWPAPAANDTEEESAQ
ncbi:MAG: endolytic transglycosylase MltG [Marinobacter sp.]|nr:endolytic transglycosylase MltG [Marinobacter sp.]